MRELCLRPRYSPRRDALHCENTHTTTSRRVAAFSVNEFSGELCYDYDYTLNPDVKMWNSNRNGYYKISVDPDSQSLQFYCMESGSDKLTTDC